ncbi:MAG: class I SAM-dependent methyltransferase [Cytophagaceae bacterium]|nr:class I SAM-dependent methyltransferase [Cytophagaceae bacterium]
MTINELKENCIAVENVYLNKDQESKKDKQILKSNFDFTDKDILVAGCEMGGLTLWLSKEWNCSVTGVDSDPYKIEIAEIVKTKHKPKNVRFEHKDILLQPVTERFDYIILGNITENMPLQILEILLKKLSNSLKNKGKIILEYRPWGSPYLTDFQEKTNQYWGYLLPASIRSFLLKRKTNIKMTGLDENDSNCYINYKKVSTISSRLGLEMSSRITQSILDKYAIFKNTKPTKSIFKFFITKEFLVLSSKQEIKIGNIKRKIAEVA